MARMKDTTHKKKADNKTPAAGKKKAVGKKKNNEVVLRKTKATAKSNKSAKSDVCGKCGQYSGYLKWIQCDGCQEWFHCNCVRVYDMKAVKIYYCWLCCVKQHKDLENGECRLKLITSHYRHNTSEPIQEGKNKGKVQSGTRLFQEQLLTKRTFSVPIEGTDIHILPNGEHLEEHFKKHGFYTPIVLRRKDGLNMQVPDGFKDTDLLNYLDPLLEIDVIDVRTQKLVQVTLQEFLELLDFSKKPYNSISLELSRSDLSSQIRPPQVVLDCSWTEEGYKYPELAKHRPAVEKYCLVSMPESYTDFHLDFSGTSVWYHVLKGSKRFYFVKPTKENLAIYRHLETADRHHEVFFSDAIRDKTYQVDLNQGDTLLLPTGYIHAVYTPDRSLVFGGNFLATFRADMQIEIFQMEEQLKTEEKMKYPYFKLTHWLAIPKVSAELKRDLASLTKENCERDERTRWRYRSYQAFIEYTLKFYHEQSTLRRSKRSQSNSEELSSSEDSQATEVEEEELDEWRTICGHDHLELLEEMKRLLDAIGYQLPKEPELERPVEELVNESLKAARKALAAGQVLVAGQALETPLETPQADAEQAARSLKRKSTETKPTRAKRVRNSQGKFVPEESPPSKSPPAKSPPAKPAQSKSPKPAKTKSPAEPAEPNSPRTEASQTEPLESEPPSQSPPPKLQPPESPQTPLMVKIPISAVDKSVHTSPPSANPEIKVIQKTKPVHTSPSSAHSDRKVTPKPKPSPAQRHPNGRSPHHSTHPNGNHLKSPIINGNGVHPDSNRLDQLIPSVLKASSASRPPNIKIPKKLPQETKDDQSTQGIDEDWLDDEPEPVKIAEKPVKISEQSVKISEQPAKITEPVKVPEQSVKIAEQPVKDLEEPAKVPEQPTKVPDLLAKHLEQAAKAPEPTTKLPQQPVKVLEEPAKAPEQLARLPEQTVKASEQSTKLPELLAKHLEQPANVTEQTVKAPEHSAKLPEQAAKAPEPPVKASEQTAKLPEQPALEPQVKVKLEEPAKASEQTVETAEQPVKTLEQTVKSEQTVQLPEQSTPGPQIKLEQQIKTEQTAKLPEPSINAPEQIVKTAEQTANAPESPAKTPEKSVVKQEEPIKIGGQSGVLRLNSDVKTPIYDIRYQPQPSNSVDKAEQSNGVPPACGQQATAEQTAQQVTSQGATPQVATSQQTVQPIDEPEDWVD